MTTLPTWTILVPTLGERAALFKRLMDVLLPQLDAFDGLVRVTGWFNNGKPSLPVIRQTLVKTCTSDYLSFIDDDDLVPDYFVGQAMVALAVRPDYVGFDVQCYSDGVPIGIARHSLEFKRWRNFPGRFERDISHINPIRTTIAQRADFTHARRGQAEDRMWAEQIRRGRLLSRQVLVSRTMYHYLYSTSAVAGEGTRWRSHSVIAPSLDRPVIDHPYFSWSDDAR